MIWLYRLLFIPALVLSLPYYLARMLRRGGYRRDFGHRFGFLPRLPAVAAGKRRIWIQAVSVGEINAVTPLIQKLHASGQFELVVTTTTSTGYVLARDKLADVCCALGVFPLDFWLCNALAWRRLRPDAVVLMEGELWPEHCCRARRRKVPLFLINARMSDRSFLRYQRLGFVARWIVRKPNAILASTQQDAQRFTKLGADDSAVSVTGNMKFDVASDGAGDTETLAALLHELNFCPATSDAAPRILLGSSTWQGEESMLLDAFQTARKAGIDCRLLLVPRHAERRNEICALLELQNEPWHLRSRGHTPAQPVMIYVADTTGELNRLTQAADVVFIGKSLPPNEGGQTPIEAAAQGKPIVYGPQMSNFRELCNSLEKASAAVRVADADAALDALMELLADSERCAALGTTAAAWHQQHRGATDKNYQVIVTS